MPRKNSSPKTDVRKCVLRSDVRRIALEYINTMIRRDAGASPEWSIVLVNGIVERHAYVEADEREALAVERELAEALRKAHDYAGKHSVDFRLREFLRRTPLSNLTWGLAPRDPARLSDEKTRERLIDHFAVLGVPWRGRNHSEESVDYVHELRAVYGLEVHAVHAGGKPTVQDLALILLAAFDGDEGVKLSSAEGFNVLFGRAIDSVKKIGKKIRKRGTAKV